MKKTSITHNSFSLRYMAVSAPQWISNGGVINSYSLNSRTPFSLQNAVRLGAYDALNTNNTWSQSKWSNQDLLKDSVFLMNYFEEEKEFFIKKLLEIRPKILFLGAMTLCYPGAIKLAGIAKRYLGNEVFIVLGGKHPTETIYSSGDIKHHSGSPIRHIQHNLIPNVFDLVVSGDGEEVVQNLGEVLGRDILDGLAFRNFSDYKDSFSNIKGRFILSWIDDEKVQNIESKKLLDYDKLPSPVSLFGVSTRFPVFHKDYTAHVYSDIGKGCMYDCFFCSERRTVNGTVGHHKNPELRLYNQLKEVTDIHTSVSAFIEDSILLMGIPKNLNNLANLLEKDPLDISFGGQLTIDNLLDEKVQAGILRLKAMGLSYVFTGIETSNEEIAQTMSKNNHKKGNWMDKNKNALKFMLDIGLNVGVSVLWGLGEDHSTRIEQLKFLSKIQKKYPKLNCVSLNWATQHPLFNQSVHSFVEWGTDKNSEYLSYFIELFGEASEKYILDGIELPNIDELSELKSLFESLTIKNIT